MLLANKVKVLTIAAIIAAVSACSSTKNVDYQEEVVLESKTYTPIHKQVVEESTTLVSDSQNARYEEMEEGTVIIASVPAKSTEKDIIDDIKDGVNSQVNVIETNAAYDGGVNIPAAKIETVVAEPSVSYQIATINFADGSALIDSVYNQKLKEIALLAKEKNAQVSVYGFASSRTKNTDIVTHKMINFNASLQRAQNVVNALIKAGVPRNSITMEALSDSQPLYQEVMPEGERLNRRAEIYISY